MLPALRDRENLTVSCSLSDFGAGDVDSYNLFYIYIYIYIYICVCVCVCVFN